jgi:hypothetical protein
MSFVIAPEASSDLPLEGGLTYAHLVRRDREQNSAASGRVGFG